MMCVDVIKSSVLPSKLGVESLLVLLCHVTSMCHVTTACDVQAGNRISSLDGVVFPAGLTELRLVRAGDELCKPKANA